MGADVRNPAVQPLIITLLHVRPPPHWLRQLQLCSPSVCVIHQHQQPRGHALHRKPDPAGVRARKFARQLARRHGEIVPAGSDLVFQMHYMAHGHATKIQHRHHLPQIHRSSASSRCNSPTIVCNPSGRNDIALSPRLPCPHDVVLLSFFPHYAPARKTLRIQYFAPRQNAEPLLRQLQFLPPKLRHIASPSPRCCPPATEGKPSPGTTIPKIIPTIPIPTPPSAGAINRQNDGRIFRRSKGGSGQAPLLIRAPPSAASSIDSLPRHEPRLSYHQKPLRS